MQIARPDPMLKKIISKEMKYTGKELQSHFAYNNFGLHGDSIVAFLGECDISRDNMVDLEDVRNKSKIYSRKMLHFIIEHFDCNLENIILKQRIFASIVKDEISKVIKKNLIRMGDDIYDGNKKLSISIATVSPVSGMIHFGINVISKGTPVSAVGLTDYKINPKNFAGVIICKYIEEIESINKVKCKVKWID